MKNVFIVLVLAATLFIVGCQQAETAHTMTSSALFRDRCVMGPGMDCDDIILENGELILTIHNERFDYLMLDDATVNVLGGDDEKINIDCRFSDYEIEKYNSFDLSCELDDALLSELKRGSFRFQLDAFEGRNYDDIAFEGDIYVSDIGED